MSEKGRIFGLDLLRAFAVIFVVLAHGWGLVDGTWVSDVVPGRLYNWFILDGVGIFFVLSGFLIGRILLRTVSKESFDGPMLFEFWVRRWFRTLPNYFLVLTILVITHLVLWGKTPDHIFRYFTFTQNIFSPHPGFFGEAWSLAIEEWFYLFVPIPLYLATRIKILDRRAIILIWISAVIVSSTALRVYRAYYFDFSDFSAWDLDIRKQVLTRMDSLMYGVLGAYISISFEKFWNRVASSALFVGIALLILDKTLTMIATDTFYRNYLTLSVAAIGTGLLLPKLSTWQRSEGLIVKMITFFSLTSYSMYLIHLSLVQLTILPIAMKYIMYPIPMFKDYEPVIAYSFYWFISVSFSYLIYRFFEKPMTALRNRWPSRGRHVVKAFSTAGNPIEPLARRDLSRPNLKDL